MRFIVAVDCEGPACVVGQAGKGLSESSNFEFARRQATREANAAALGLFDAGATQVIVWDNHAGSLNLHYDDLDERCDILLGTGCERCWPGLDESFAGVAMIGYHPMDNTIDGVLAHTFSSKAYQYIKINGVEVGEIAIHAAIAGEKKVPLILVASDDKGVAEARRFMPHVQAVTTKTGLGWNMALSKHPRRAQAEIQQAAAQAVARLKEMKHFRFQEPLTIEIRYKRIEAAEAASRGTVRWRRIDAYTCQRKVERLSDQW